jgi:hypothetical protein
VVIVFIVASHQFTVSLVANDQPRHSFLSGVARHLASRHENIKIGQHGQAMLPHPRV